MTTADAMTATDAVVVSDAPADAGPDATSAADAAAGCAWQVETVATSTEPGKPLIAVAPDGRVDILFHDTALCGSLRHASKATAATTWSDEVLDSQLGSLYSISAMTGDASGDLHAAYYGGPDTNPPCVGGPSRTIYARASDGVWGRQIITRNRRNYILAIDAAGGEAHVAYVEEQSALGYAHGTLAAEFATQIVPTTPPDDPIGAHPSLRVDHAGVVHVVSLRDHGNTASDALVYLERSTAGVWSSVTTIDEGRGTGNSSSIDIDAAGGLHVVYWKGVALSVGYAYRPPGGTWSTSVLDADRVFAQPAIRVDHSGVLHATYIGGNPFRVRHAHAAIGGAWQIEPIGDDVDVFGPTIAFGPNDALHVAYAHGDTVRHAHRVCR